MVDRVSRVRRTECVSFYATSTLLLQDPLCVLVFLAHGRKRGEIFMRFLPLVNFDRHPRKSAERVHNSPLILRVCVCVCRGVRASFSL